MLTTSGANSFLNALFASGATVRLHTGVPGDNLANEVNGNGYVAAKLTADNCGVATNGIAANKGIIFFPEATASWGTITHFSITGGGYSLWGALTTPVEVPANYIPIFRASALKISVDREIT